MHISNLITLTYLTALATAVPTRTLIPRADSCAQYATVQTGPYTVSNNLWGEGSATSGSQCMGVDGLSGTTLKWHTSWTWQGGPNNVKSYANAIVSLTPTPLAHVSSIPSTWTYTQTGSNLVADVAYDIFTDANPANTGGGDHHDYEIMIWLADLGGANPIATSYNANGAVPTTSNLALAGSTWNMYKGPSGALGGGTVFSFIATKQITSFSADLMTFIKYLETNQGLPTTQNLVYVGAGTEPFTGSNAVFTTTGYSTTIKYM